MIEIRHVWVLHRPRISIWQAQTAWVCHNGVMYAIETMSTMLFKAVILKASPSAITSMPRLMQKGELDIVERWYMLLRTTDGKYPIKLYYLKEGVFCDNNY
jgi:hypothetical protein